MKYVLSRLGVPCLFLGMLTMLDCPASAQTSWTGPQLSDGFGRSVAIIGDVDNPKNGVREVLVGASGKLGSKYGRAYVYRIGSATPVRVHKSNSNNYGWFGHFVGDVGDLDNDGWSDYAIGAPTMVISTTAEGQLYLYSGKTGLPLQVLNAPSGSGRFGFRAVSVGDLNNDGKSDIAVSAPETRQPGTVHVYLSTSNGHVAASYNPLSISAQADQLGRSLVFLGGASNTLAVGAPNVHFHPSRQLAGAVARWDLTSTTNKKLPLLTRDKAGDFFGFSVSAVGDLDADTVQDVAVGSAGGNGLVGFFSGGSGKEMYQFSDARARVGSNLATIGDVNSDGAKDVVTVGATQLQVISGKDGSRITRIGVAPNTTVDAGPDIWGSGGCDILTGSSGSSIFGSARIIDFAETKVVGSGCSSVAAAPTLTATPRPRRGQFITVTARSFYSRPTRAFMVLDLGPPKPTAFGPCTWYFGPTAFIAAVANVAYPPGTFSLSGRVPPTIPLGRAFVLQAIYAPSPTTPEVSNAIVLRVGAF